MKSIINRATAHKVLSKIFCSVMIAMAIISFASCSTAKIYTKPDVMSYTRQHKTLAIVPPKVHCEPNEHESVESVNEREKALSINAQNTMFNNFYKYGQKKGHIYIDVQDVEKTNKLLEKFGCPYGNCTMTPEELADALGVDALIMTDGDLERIYARNVGYGIVYAIVFFPYGTPLGIMLACQKTGLGTVNLKLYDGKSGSLLWTYSDKYSFQKLGEDEIFMMKRAVKKCPYYE